MSEPQVIQERCRCWSFGHDHGASAPVVGGCPRHEVALKVGCLLAKSTSPGHRHSDDSVWDDSQHCPSQTGECEGSWQATSIRRLVARTMAQQLQKAVEVATAPFQCALSTKAGCECVAHALQGSTQWQPDSTVTFIDGISAFDLISRESMLTGLTRG